MQGTASRSSERVNEARPQKSSRQKVPVTLYTSRVRGSAKEVQPGDYSIIPGYLPPLPLRAVAFLPPFLLDALPPLVEELLCLLLLAGAFLATVFAAGLCPCPLTLQPSTFSTGLAASPALLLPASP